MEKGGVIFNIEHSSFVDGPGIRTTVFFKGCNLRCAWCHNPESQSFLPQMMIYKEKCVSCGRCKEKCPNGLENCTLCGACALYCPADARRIKGKNYTVEEVLDEVLSDAPFYESSGGGATFSGGECMLQIDFLAEMLKKCKENSIHTAVDTAGHVPYESFEKILDLTDIFLYDVKCFDSEKHKKYTGVGNELILENLARLLRTGKRIWVRIPIITGVNDSVDEMLAIKNFFDERGHPEKIELLPYHSMGEHKYAAIGRKAHIFSVPSEEKMAELKRVFS